MRKAEAIARKVAEEDRDAAMDNLLRELIRLHRTLPLENYLQVIENFVDNARKTLTQVPDPQKRKHLREQYRRVIEFAVDLGAGVSG